MVFSIETTKATTTTATTITTTTTTTTAKTTTTKTTTTNLMISTKAKGQGWKAGKLRADDYEGRSIFFLLVKIIAWKLHNIDQIIYI